MIVREATQIKMKSLPGTGLLKSCVLSPRLWQGLEKIKREQEAADSMGVVRAVDRVR